MNLKELELVIGLVWIITSFSVGVYLTVERDWEIWEALFVCCLITILFAFIGALS